MDAGLAPLKLALLAFWGAWFALVVLTNVLGGLKALGRLPPAWPFASRNYEAVQKALAAYRPPPWVAPLLFAGVVAWQAAAAALFGWAALSSGPGAINLEAANLALAAGILLWGAFMLADEATLRYEFERTHELLFLAQVATLLALHLLPGGTEPMR